jgi:major membrane immunogen (membrane-anchored lipoprotein)
MNKNLTFGAVLILAALLSVCAQNAAKDNPVEVVTPVVDSGRYVNGAYDGQTPKDGEGYTTFASIQVRQGDIASVNWRIYDNNLKRNFDSTYEEIYRTIPLYQQQCRDNMVGMKVFGPELIETQSIDSVDCITGATWCWNKFKEVVQIALKDARPDSAASDQR